MAAGVNRKNLTDFVILFVCNEKYCREVSKNVLQSQKSNRVTGCVDLILKKNGGDAMKKRKHKIHISLMELLTFGTFLLALLTFVFTFCK